MNNPKEENQTALAAKMFIIRDTEFRALTSAGEWLFGYLVIMNNEARICAPSEGQLKVNFVRRETAGQWSGKLDKKGTKIFEHDLVKYKDGVRLVNFSDGSFSLDNMFMRPLSQIRSDELEVVGNLFEELPPIRGIVTDNLRNIHNTEEIELLTDWKKVLNLPINTCFSIIFRNEITHWRFISKYPHFEAFIAVSSENTFRAEVFSLSHFHNPEYKFYLHHIIDVTEDMERIAKTLNK